MCFKNVYNKSRSNFVFTFDYFIFLVNFSCFDFELRRFVKRSIYTCTVLKKKKKLKTGQEKT